MAAFDNSCHSSPPSIKLQLMKRTHATVLLLLLAASVAYADVTGRVVAVTDGDTIKVLDANEVQHKVRLTGIDAPERGQPFGTVSRDHLASMVAGKDVRVESTKNDRYGRLLGKAWVQPADCPSCGEIPDANYAQVLAGMAWWYLNQDIEWRVNP